MRSTSAYLSGDTEAAKKIQLKYLNLINALFCETNPVPVKSFAWKWQACEAGGCRLPLEPLSSANRRVLSSLCDEFIVESD